MSCKDVNIKINDDDEKLPEVLEKLQIVPLIPIVKSQNDDELPLLLNPFYIQTNNRQIIKNNDEIIISDDDDNNNDEVKKIFGTTNNNVQCKCSLKKFQQQQKNIERIIIKQTRFKRRNSSKRIYLKESLLKTIQNCTHTHATTITQSLSSSSLTSSSSNNTVTQQTTKGTILEFSDYPTLEDLRLEDDLSRTTRTAKESRSTGINYKIFIKDFDLLSAYCNLSTSSLSTGEGYSKNFTTLQSSDNRLIKYNPSKRIILKNGEIKNSNKNQQQQNSILNATSPSSSCSQQARNNHHSSSMIKTTTTATSTTVSCDITIDELASYFETFVHIPKKMSEMAEMMYI